MENMAWIDPGPQVFLTDSGELKGLKNMSDPDVERLAKAIKKQYSPLKWSSSPPDREGWWWMRYGPLPEYAARIVLIESNYEDELEVNNSNSYDNNWLVRIFTDQYSNVQWSGPIPEPEED